MFMIASKEKDMVITHEMKDMVNANGNRTDCGYSYLWQSYCCYVGGSVGMLAKE